MPESKFTPAQAEELAAAFAREGVDYLFIGKSGAILLGYPDTTQVVDIFLPQSRENGERVLRALRTLGFELDPVLTISILAGCEIVLLKAGPFALDLIHAPDAIESFEGAKSRSVLEGGRFPVASLEDIIASKRAMGREKDITMCAGSSSSESNTSGGSYDHARCGPGATCRRADWFCPCV